MIVQAGSDEDAKRSLRAIERDFRGLGQLVDRVEYRWCFPLSLLVV